MKKQTTFREQIKEIVEKYGESQDTRDMSNQLCGYEIGRLSAISDVEKILDECKKYRITKWTKIRDYAEEWLRRRELISIREIEQGIQKLKEMK